VGGAWRSLYHKGTVLDVALGIGAILENGFCRGFGTTAPQPLPHSAATRPLPAHAMLVVQHASGAHTTGARAWPASYAPVGVFGAPLRLTTE
jgi:hypothetical protein